jgi:hypothetical protein
LEEATNVVQDEAVSDEPISTEAPNETPVSVDETATPDQSNVGAEALSASEPESTP